MPLRAPAPEVQFGWKLRLLWAHSYFISVPFLASPADFGEQPADQALCSPGNVVPDPAVGALGKQTDAGTAAPEHRPVGSQLHAAFICGMSSAQPLCPDPGASGTICWEAEPQPLASSRGRGCKATGSSVLQSPFIRRAVLAAVPPEDTPGHSSFGMNFQSQPCWFYFNSFDSPGKGLGLRCLSGALLCCFTSLTTRVSVI